MVARKAKRSEGLDSRGKAGEKGGKGPSGFLNRRPPVRIRTGSLRKSAKRLGILGYPWLTAQADGAAVESRLSGGEFPAPSALVSRIARISSGYVVRATFVGPDFRRHEVEASSPTFGGALAELAQAVASTLGAA